MGEDIIRMELTWHTADDTDTCKSVAMWSLYCPNCTQIHRLPLRDKMEENLRRNIPLPLPDHEVMAGCMSELTRTNSDSSALTVTCSKDFSRRNENARPGPSTVWTDEKHSLFLDSLEASFVNQLHSSIGLRGCLQEIIQGPYSWQELPTNGQNYSHQVRRNGCWRTNNFGKNEPLLESTADSHFIQQNPWIDCFTSAGEQHIAASHDLQEHRAPCTMGIHVKGKSTVSYGLVRSSEQHPACRQCHQDFVGSTKEVSDQNFVDEDQGEKSNCLPMAKRLKTVGSGSPSNNQVMCRINSVSTC